MYNPIQSSDQPQDQAMSGYTQPSTNLLHPQTTPPKWKVQKRQAKWGINWRAPSKMFGLLVFGLGVAFCHYLYFQSLDGTIVSPAKGRVGLNDQEWHARFGTALAFLVKTCFAAAVSIAYKQSAWLNMRSEAHSVSGLDSMFSGTTDILAYFSLDFVVGAKITALVAGVTWLMPLSALVAQATLTVAPSSVTTNGPQLVPSLDFSSQNFLSNGLDDDVAPILSRISCATVSIPAILPMEAVFPNSTYDLSFAGPGLTCNNATDKTTISSINAAVKTRISAINAAEINESSGYSGSNTIVYLAGFSADCPSCYFEDTSLWFRFGDESLVCSLQNITYNIHISSTESTATVQHTPPDTWRREAFDSNSRSSFAQNYVSYMQALSNFFIGSIGVSVLYANSSSPVAMAWCDTRVADTAIESLIVDAVNNAGNTLAIENMVEPSAWKLDFAVSSADRALARNLTLGPLVEEIASNITLSLFSDRRYWSETGASANVATTTPVNRYYFNAQNLIFSYGIAFAISLLCVSIGLHAMYVNGVSHSMSFSTIVAVTRNPILDHLFFGNSLGSEPLSKDVMAQRLVFGVLQQSDSDMKDLGEVGFTSSSGVDHTCFGLSDEIIKVKRGQVVS